MDRNSCKPLSCFGRLDCVFPKSADGLRHTPDKCLQCPEKVNCLRAAVRGEDGLAVKEEKLDRDYASGHVGFLERWARKKNFRRRKQRRRQPAGWVRSAKKKFREGRG